MTPKRQPPLAVQRRPRFSWGCDDRASMRNIRRNLFFVFVRNPLGVPIAVPVKPSVLRAFAIIRFMTLVEITYELQSPLTTEQFRRLGAFANTYGLRRFRSDGSKTHLTLEYDASRLKETEVTHVLWQARIPVRGKVEAAAA